MLDFKAAIFDLDGTLIDSNIIWEKINRIYFTKHNISISDEEIRKFTSMNFEDIADYFIKVFKLTANMDEFISECNEMAVVEYQYNIMLKANAKEYLEYLRENDIKIGLATASNKSLYEPVLKNNGIYDYFDALTTTREVQRGKGYPDIYLLTAEKLGVSPEDCVVFEDILAGIKGAKAANMRAYGVHDLYSEHNREEIEKLADGYIFDFAAMIKNT